jgi:ketosteroid isomerase-like protein
MVSDIEVNKEIVRGFMQAMSAGDTAYILEAYADDGYVHTMGNTLISGKYGKQQIREFADSIYDVFPAGIEFTVLSMTAEDDRVSVEAESRGEHASGQTYNNFYHFMFRLRDGKVASLTEYLDTELATDIICGGQRPG